MFTNACSAKRMPACRRLSRRLGSQCRLCSCATRSATDFRVCFSRCIFMSFVMYMTKGTQVYTAQPCKQRCSCPGTLTCLLGFCACCLSCSSLTQAQENEQRKGRKLFYSRHVPMQLCIGMLIFSVLACWVKKLGGADLRKSAMQCKVLIKAMHRSVGQGVAFCNIRWQSQYLKAGSGGIRLPIMTSVYLRPKRIHACLSQRQLLTCTHGTSLAQNRRQIQLHPGRLLMHLI